MRAQLEQVSFAYPGTAALFRDVDLVIEPGDFAVIRGPSGSGKSSMLRLLNRLSEPSGGRVLIDGQPAVDMDVTVLRRRIGYVQQTPVMIAGSVRDNLQLPFRYAAAAGVKAPDDGVLKRLLRTYLLPTVDLDSDASALSVGQRQRIALIRALLVEPEILLCDEPTSALDPESRNVVEGELVRRNREHGTSIVLVTHLDAAAIDDAAPQQWFLADGRLTYGNGPTTTRTR